MYPGHHGFHSFRAKVQCIINFRCHLNLDHGICNNIVTLQNIGGVQVFHTTDLHVSLWNVDHATALSSLFLFVCFFFCQNFSAIISNKIKFLTHISLIGKSRLGFLPNGNLPLHGFQYNSSKLYKIFFQSLCWLKNLGKKSRFCNTFVKLTYIFAPWITGQLVNCPLYTLTCWQLSLDGSILSSKSPFPK